MDSVRDDGTRLPRPRGPISAGLFDELRRAPHDLPGHLTSLVREGAGFHDDDLQLALFVCYELHYRGFDDMEVSWEWDPSLLRLRQVLEERFERALRDLVPRPVANGEITDELLRLVETGESAPLAGFLQHESTLEQFREFVIHRSIYHLKEADPHTWGIPRLAGRSKAALVEIQADEYGGGRVELMHAELFRTTMRGLGLDDAYGAYVEAVPAVTLAVNNLMSFFGLHRRHLGALMGHLAVFEMTSSLPNRRYSSGLARLGADRRTRRFYDEHVQADAVHEQLAAHDLCGGLVAWRPGLADDVLFGAACCLALDRLFAEHLLSRWRQGDSTSLLGPVDAPLQR